MPRHRLGARLRERWTVAGHVAGTVPRAVHVLVQDVLAPARAVALATVAEAALAVLGTVPEAAAAVAAGVVPVSVVGAVVAVAAAYVPDVPVVPRQHRSKEGSWLFL